MMSRILAELFQKAQKIKSKVADARQKLALRHVEALSPDGAVKVVASCDKQIVSIVVKPESRNSPELEKAIADTANEALKKAEAVLKEELNSAMGEAGINLPGLF